jgi:tetratricopeptide (TPR) repeat protein
MAKTPKSKPVTDDAAKSAAAAAANAAAPAPQDAPAPLAELTADALQARADEWDAAREALKAAGDAAAAAQAALDALPADASDEQRDDALRALADAENAVKTAQGVIEKLSAPAAFAIEGSSGEAVVTATEAGLGVTLTQPQATKAVTVKLNLSSMVREHGLAFITQDAERVLKSADEAFAAFDYQGAVETLDKEIAAAGEFIDALEQFQNALIARREQIEPQPLRGFLAQQEGKIAVRVTGPKAGRWRAGQFWGPEPVEAELTHEAWMALTADSAFTVETLDDGT